MDSPSEQGSGWGHGQSDSVVFGRAVGSWGSVTGGMYGDRVLRDDQDQEVDVAGEDEHEDEDEYEDEEEC